MGTESNHLRHTFLHVWNSGRRSPTDALAGVTNRHKAMSSRSARHGSFEMVFAAMAQRYRVATGRPSMETSGQSGGSQPVMMGVMVVKVDSSELADQQRRIKEPQTPNLASSALGALACDKHCGGLGSAILAASAMA